MKEIQISKFKATCLAVLDEVGKTGQPVRITRFGKPVADVVPPKLERKGSSFGCMADEMEITGDLVAPVHAFAEWEIEQDEDVA